MFKYFKRADKALELTQFSLDHTRDAYYGMTRDAQIFYANNAACEDLGYTREELVGMSIPDIDPNASHKGWPLHWEELRRVRSKRFESTHQRKDGMIFPVEVCVNLIEFEGEEYNFASCRDISERKQAESQLKFLEHLMEYSRDTAFVTRRDARLIYANEAACESLGYSREELLDLEIPDIDPNFDRKKWDAHWKKTKKTGLRIFESHHRKKDGTVFPVEVKVSHVSYEGEAYHFSTARDITEHKQAESQLKFLEHLMEHGRDAFFVTKRDALFIYVNDAACESLGYSREELLSLSVLDINPSVTRKKWEEHWRGTEESGSRQFETHHKRKDGTVFPVEVKVSTVSYEGETYHFSSVRDITERKQAEEALNRSEQKFSKAFQASPDLMALTTLKDGTHVDVNDQWLEALGYDRVEVIGKTATEIGVWEDTKYRRHLLKGLKKDGSARNLEARMKTKSGELRDVLVSAELIKLDGTDHIITVAHDITERKTIDARLRQTQKMETIGQIAGGVAHEFNNMLQGIQGNLELIEEGITDRQELMPFMIAVMKSAERSKNLTRDLMTYSRLRTLSPQRMDIAGIIRESSRNFSLMLGETVDIRTVIAKKSGDVIVDPGELEGALLNLAVNARDAMADGGAITVKLANTKLGEEKAGELEEKPGDYVTVSVSDTGAGMPAEVLERAFDPFYTTKKVGKGSGLGLSMVYGFVKQSGGYTQIESTPGKGTTASMHLPRAKGAAGKRKKTKTPQPSPELPTGDETVLLAEDDPVVRMLGVLMLKKLGYTVIEAADGAKALKALKTRKGGKKVHLLLTDVVMPGGMSGIELAKKARKLDPDIGVLLCTGYNPDEIREKMKGDITFPMILKPYRKDELAFRVREILDGAS
ncbi:MAG: PAS domain S-box protein [Alphaproteobacteria bacterium]|nr:PAS domain S-box protein [Alphaproteobacteria bacterium]